MHRRARIMGVRRQGCMGHAWMHGRRMHGGPVGPYRSLHGMMGERTHDRGRSRCHAFVGRDTALQGTCIPSQTGVTFLYSKLPCREGRKQRIVVRIIERINITGYTSNDGAEDDLRSSFHAPADMRFALDPEAAAASSSFFCLSCRRFEES